MTKYIDEITEANYFPTLTQRCQQLAKQGIKPVPSEVYGTKGEAVQVAGENFLKRIHQEIFFNLPQSEKDKITEDLEALDKENKFDTLTEIKAFRPALTVDYLKSIGKELYANWGTGEN